MQCALKLVSQGAVVSQPKQNFGFFAYTGISRENIFMLRYAEIHNGFPLVTVVKSLSCVCSMSTGLD